MILLDTSIWIDHLRHGDEEVARLLERELVLVHPFVVGELACGHLRSRATVLDLLKQLPSAEVAEAHEVLAYIDGRRLFGRSIGYVDAHLLASIALTAGSVLWTRDRRLHSVATELGCAFPAAYGH